MLIKYNLLNIINIIRMPWTRRKYFNVVWMMIIFFLDSSKLYKYSVRSCLPSEDMKDEYKDSLLEIYQPKVESNFTIDKIDRNLYARGHVGPIDYNQAFLINFRVTDENRNAIFITADGKYLDYYLKEKVDFVYVNRTTIDNNERVRKCSVLQDRQKIKILTVYMKTNSHLQHVPMGSAIISILALLMISKTVTVYGWNHYQTKKMSSMGSIEFIFNVFFYLRDYETRDCVEYSLTHLFYAYYFDKIENLKIYGNLSYFENKKRDKFFTKKIQKIFLNHCD